MKNELIDKLNKKDKEEMLSRIKIEKDKSYFGFGFEFVSIFVKYVILFAIVVPLWFIAFREEFVTLLLAGVGSFLIIGKVILYCIVVGFILDYLVFVFRLVRINKIKREYFDIVPKRR